MPDRFVELQKDTNNLLIPESFASKLEQLIETNNLIKLQHSTDKLIEIPSHEPFPARSTYSNPVENVEHDVSQILAYFSEARRLLSNTFAEEDVRWVYEELPAVRNVTECVMAASEYLPNLMTVLEMFKREHEIELATNFQTADSLQSLPTPRPTTNTASLSRAQRRKALESITPEKLLEVADKIEIATAEWKELHELTAVLLNRLALANEWYEFDSVIMSEIESEIDSCYLAIQKFKDTQFEFGRADDLGFLMNSLTQNIPFGIERLPYQSEFEKKCILE